MGDKTYRWEDGATKNEVKFNFTTDLDGKALQEWFEKIADKSSPSNAPCASTSSA